ncbi:transmembrane sensor [Pedobacter sp. W3I1]|uniref:FecR family protein n=1 Tax=Pedobacter sp. W3I1 TaxID=3042291 RepID=UPI00278ADE2E|nr:FecR family protein [Pedobacter sp. W3I1]MDQ0640048.1 transmembrane sensor [Pedobacter sp. W3I1]
MTENEYLSLCEKYLRGACTLEEEHILSAYQDAQGLSGLSLSEEEEKRLGEILKARIQNSINGESPVKSPLRIRRLKWQIAAAIAASVLLFIYFGTDLFRSAKRKENTVLVKKETIRNKDILPGSTNAVLTLSNGERIKLDGTGDGIISKDGNTHISKSGNGLVVSATGKSLNNVLNKITIPKGGKYDITLPDGTRVWLNSASSLSFPTAFTGRERKVLLTGEAYFEVAKNKEMPFKVDVEGKQEVEVLGTHFNITAFAEDKNIMTTLLEGAVKINYKKSSTLIKPGQMAINNLQNNLKVVPADLEEVMAWKNDMFIFNNENISSIMKKISRWYDVDVEYKGDVSGVNFDGNYSRSKGLKSLLKNIELTDKVRFVIEGRRITVIVK